MEITFVKFLFLIAWNELLFYAVLNKIIAFYIKKKENSVVRSLYTSRYYSDL